MNEATTPTLDLHTSQLLFSVTELLDHNSAPAEALSQASRKLCEHLLQRFRVPNPLQEARIALAPWQVRKAKEILATSVNRRTFIADVAAQCFLSRSHFSRAFKKTTGMSPQDWALNYRVERAKDLLLCSALSISQVSQECGFADQSHFCRVFNKYERTSPSKWRQCYAQGAA